MPLNSQWKKDRLLDAAETEASIEQLAIELGEIDEELDMYASAGVIRFLEKLSRMESSALDAMMVASTPEELVGARERVRAIRALLSDKEELERKRQSIESSLAELTHEE